MASTRIPIFVLWTAGLVCACDYSGTDVTETPLTRITITDLKGERWDITQAVERYGFDPGEFLFGLGASQLPPLVLPPVVLPSDSGYPEPDADFTVVGMVASGSARAYALADLLDIEVSNDTLAGAAIAVVHRPLTDAPSVYARRVGSADIVLGPSGWVYDNQSLLVDIATRGLWYRFDGERELTCITGLRFGTRLLERAHTVTSWNAWFAAHPATGFSRRPPVPPTNERSWTRAGTTTPSPTGSQPPAR